MTNEDFLSLLSSASSVIKVHSLVEKLKGDGLNYYFGKALRQTAIKLDKEFEKQLFGNSTESILLKQVDEIVRHFEPYGHLANLQDQLAWGIDFHTLPPSFFETFKRILIEEINRFRKLKPVLANHLQTFQIDETHKKVSAIPSIVEKLDKLISLVEDSDVQLPPKVIYTFKHQHFISRRLYPKSSETLSESISHFLLELIQHDQAKAPKEEKRLVVLGYAGSGKSLEIDYLLSRLSEDPIYFPMKISLGNTNITDDCIEEFFDKKHPGWRILNVELVILIDGLDEVGEDHVDSVRNQIHQLSEIKDESAIVVTCRNNGYFLNGTEGYLKGFTVYQLPPFSWQEVNDYVTSKIVGYQQQQTFLKKIDSHGFRDDMTTPFYLANLADFFLERENSLPESKTELFEFLIENLKKREKAKSHKRRAAINKIETELDEAIAKTAFVFQCTDNNFLTNGELQKVIINSRVLEAIKDCYVLDNGGEEKWQFEHNNFKEYLCAKFLASKDFSFIEKILFVPKINKIKPRWLNTLGFLISILPKSQEPAISLVDHLKDSDPESLVRIEKIS
ncbi:MAG: hypothetical protein RIF36_17610 [Imperialibacter sp.]|uniref:NACHT domain-containing protein n=1 Tax=Imperialibacter sp. TaxID=2038411 RepID=UPI0032EDDF4A